MARRSLCTDGGNDGLEYVLYHAHSEDIENCYSSSGVSSHPNRLFLWKLLSADGRLRSYCGNQNSRESRKLISSLLQITTCLDRCITPLSN